MQKRSTPPAQYHYQCFPPVELQWEKIIPYIGPASRAIAYYDGVLSVIPNANVLLTPLTTQEAVLSSRIEGTQATMGEVLEYEASGDNVQYDENRKADIYEILNYRQAMHEAETLLETLPLSQRVIKELHKTLLSGVRGQNRSPGEYRKIPNWIGPYGCTLEEAHFIPISADKLQAGMNTWENFIHADFPDKLVQLALLHVEFEALHPFLDGNGRLGRMFIPLFLWQKEIISRPAFYISSVFESNRDGYYQKLRAVSQYGQWTEWVIFFLQSLDTQAKENIAKAKGILDLYDTMKNRIPELLNSQFAIKTVDWIFKVPTFSSSDFVSKADIPEATARRILPLLVEKGFLRIARPASGRRAAVYSFLKLLNLVEGQASS